MPESPHKKDRGSFWSLSIEPLQNNTKCTFAFHQQVFWGASQKVLFYLPPCRVKSGNQE